MEQENKEKKKTVKKNTTSTTTKKSSSTTKSKTTNATKKQSTKKDQGKGTTTKKKTSTNPQSKKKQPSKTTPKSKSVKKEEPKKPANKEKTPINKEIDLEKTQILSREDFNTYKKTILKEEPKQEEPLKEEKIYQTFGKTIILEDVNINNPEEVEDAIADIFSETGKISFDEIERGKLDALDNAPLITKVEKKFDIKWILSSLVVIGLLLFILYHFITFDHNKVIIKKEEPKIINENYVFFGDSLTHRYDLKKYFEGLPIVNSGVDGYKTTDLLDHMDDMLYEYNPSKVFILIGTNDIQIDTSTKDIVNNIKKIVEGIEENREHAKIYIESLYPVQSDLIKDRPNSKIREINDKLKKYCQEKNITYIDLYSVLAEDNNDLKREYSDDGLHMNKKSYEVITKELKKYIEEK